MNEIDDDWVLARQKWEFYRQCHVSINDGHKCKWKDYQCKDRLRICFTGFKANLSTEIEPIYKTKTIKIPATNKNNPFVTVDFTNEESVKKIFLQIKFYNSLLQILQLNFVIKTTSYLTLKRQQYFTLTKRQKTKF